jgi:hypothetical protein
MNKPIPSIALAALANILKPSIGPARALIPLRTAIFAIAVPLGVPGPPRVEVRP